MFTPEYSGKAPDFQLLSSTLGLFCIKVLAKEINVNKCTVKYFANSVKKEVLVGTNEETLVSSLEVATADQTHSTMHLEWA